MARSQHGFTLVELMIALAVGLVVMAGAAQTLVGSVALSRRWGDELRQREFDQRARRLMQLDRQAAEVALEGAAAEAAAGEAACGLAGRRPVLHLRLPDGKSPITWTLGSAPSAIWRGPVLMRCGPAYGLEGRLSLDGAWQNRVVLDQAEDWLALYQS
ncbi:PilW family protein [Vulcanococcus limneticus]|uniref:PilW family protein n=1 Tax=Vulcanococcus limneticus TaxID=2170428 RepID=UPI00398C17F9